MIDGATVLFEQPGTAALQATHGGHHVRTFENFHQPVEDLLMVLGSGLQKFFQYELGLANRPNCQLLIVHTRHPKWPRRQETDKSRLHWDLSSGLVEICINFYCRTVGTSGTWLFPIL
jgi:hypothetical protein